MAACHCVPVPPGGRLALPAHAGPVALRPGNQTRRPVVDYLARASALRRVHDGRQPGPGVDGGANPRAPVVADHVHAAIGLWSSPRRSLGARRCPTPRDRCRKLRRDNPQRKPGVLRMVIRARQAQNQSIEPASGGGPGSMSHHLHLTRLPGRKRRSRTAANQHPGVRNSFVTRLKTARNR